MSQKQTVINIKPGCENLLLQYLITRPYAETFQFIEVVKEGEVKNEQPQSSSIHEEQRKDIEG